MGVRAPAVVRHGRRKPGLGSHPARRLGRASRALQGAVALHAARVPRRRELRDAPSGTSRPTRPPGGRAGREAPPRTRDAQNAGRGVARARARGAGIAAPSTSAAGTRARGRPRVDPRPARARSRSPRPRPSTRSPAARRAKDDEGPPRFSLPTQSDRDAWLRGGFRLSLGPDVRPPRRPGRRAQRPAARPEGARRPAPRRRLVAVRVVSIQRRARTAGRSSALRFAGTIDPTWHATRHLSLAFGFGFGGIVEGITRPTRRRPDCRTRSRPRTRSPTRARRCRAAAASARRAGARASGRTCSGRARRPASALEVLGQWTGCVADTGRVEPDTGQAIVRRQWWPHAGATGTVELHVALTRAALALAGVALRLAGARARAPEPDAGATPTRRRRGAADAGDASPAERTRRRARGLRAAARARPTDGALPGRRARARRAGRRHGEAARRRDGRGRRRSSW